MTESLLYQWETLEGCKAPSAVRVYWDDEKDEFHSIHGKVDGAWIELSDRFWVVAGPLVLGLVAVGKKQTDDQIKFKDALVENVKVKKEAMEKLEADRHLGGWWEKQIVKMEADIKRDEDTIARIEENLK